MTKQTKTYVLSQTALLLKSECACPEAKEAAERFLDAIGTTNEKAEASRYLKELEEDLEPIDGLLAFASSPAAVKCFGAEGAKELIDHTKTLKKSGAHYCDCSACQAAAAILKEKDALLK